MGCLDKGPQKMMSKQNCAIQLTLLPTYTMADSATNSVETRLMNRALLGVGS